MNNYDRVELAVCQDYILVLQDIIARQEGCSDFWNMCYDEMTDGELYPSKMELVKNLEHTLKVAAETYKYTDDMWFMRMLKTHIEHYKYCFEE